MIYRLVVGFFTLLGLVNAENESHYRDLVSVQVGGKIEVRLPDGTRCDIVTDTHAVEVEFASKWCEGLGQALWYSFQLNKKPAVALILREDKDSRFVLRIQSLLKHRKMDDVKIWVINKEGEIMNDRDLQNTPIRN